jgi:hypothetical protein
MAQGDFVFSIKESDYARITSALAKLSEIESSVVIKQGLKRGSALLLSAGKASFLARNKKKTGNLYRSFTDSFKKKKKSLTGIFVGFKRGAGKGNHSHLIDRGTTHRYTKSGAYRGKIDEAGGGKTGKTHFWTDTANSKGSTAMQSVVNAIYRYLDAIK